jgi:phosphopantothenoylcysteine decarboxylase/phosphopantothenate--cysteine ligase
MLDAAVALVDVDVALLAAAVADYAPAPLAGKRAKDERTWTVELEPTTDIAQTLGARKQPGQILVAFGAEHGEAGLARKRAMLETKNADLVVFNDVGQPGIGFDAVENEVVLITRESERHVSRARKETVAAEILDAVQALLDAGE